MTDRNKVILARPHPMLAGGMTRFLTELGYTPAPLGDASQIAAAMTDGLVGAVISTAVVSSIKESAPEIFALLRAQRPAIPVIFATLVESDKMIDVLNREFVRKGWSVRWLSIAPETEKDAGLGREGTCLMVQQKDLEQRDRRELLGRIVLKHFG